MIDLCPAWIPNTESKEKEKQYFIFSYHTNGKNSRSCLLGLLWSSSWHNLCAGLYLEHHKSWIMYPVLLFWWENSYSIYFIAYAGNVGYTFNYNWKVETCKMAFQEGTWRTVITNLSTTLIQKITDRERHRVDIQCWDDHVFCTQRKSQCRLVKQLIAPANKGHGLRHEALKRMLVSHLSFQLGLWTWAIMPQSTMSSLNREE